MKMWLVIFDVAPVAILYFCSQWLYDGNIVAKLLYNKHFVVLCRFVTILFTAGSM